jgi:hypothetical protein
MEESELHPKFPDIFGKLTVTYTEKKAIVTFDGDVEETEYRIIRKDNSGLTISTETWGEMRLNFIQENEAYWIESGISDLWERFDKIGTEPGEIVNASAAAGKSENHLHD